MNPDLDRILASIEVAPGLHAAGTLSPAVLYAIARHASKRRICCSAETGCGASTLLFSHLSERHTVFALDDGSGSITNVRRSPLLRPDVVTFIEGPTQVTLPRHQFSEKLQLVLLDGPHAYPFPDLEYYYLYPHLESGALLIVDDLQIRSVHNLFEFLRRDVMFRLAEVVRSTAFFTRTEAPIFNPLGDGWREQKYNAMTLARYTWWDGLRSLLPGRLRRRLQRARRALKSSGWSVKILQSARRGRSGKHRHGFWDRCAARWLTSLGGGAAQGSRGMVAAGRGCGSCRQFTLASPGEVRRNTGRRSRVRNRCARGGRGDPRPLERLGRTGRGHGSVAACPTTPSEVRFRRGGARG